MKLAYGNYGMPQTPYAAMIEAVAAIGYDGLEICTAPGYPTAPDQLTATDRKVLGAALQDNGLEVASLMVAKVKVLEAEPARHSQNLETLREICLLRSDLASDVEITSTLGGKVDDWDEQGSMLVDCVADWAEQAGEHGAVFAFEPHVGGIIHSPDRALWLLEQVNLPNLKLNFDYSHFELIDISLDEAITKLIPYAAGVHVKDVDGRYPDFRFLLPGEGELDYTSYLRQVAAAGYDEYITVEISGHIFNAKGYDALRAAEYSYTTLSEAFAQAGFVRKS